MSWLRARPTRVAEDLRIAVLADPHLPVPPTLYGGIERVIYLLVEELRRRGHDVVLFAHPESRVSCELVPYPRASSNSRADLARNAAVIARRLLSRPVDVIHSFGRMAAMTPLAFTGARKFMSYQRPIAPASIRRARRIFGERLEFTACGEHMTAEVRHIGRWHVIPNAVPTDTFRFAPVVGDHAPVAFLGRFDAEKGAHLAIAAARRAGRRILVAGNVGTQPDYFERELKPLLDLEGVTYIGPVDDARKNEMLGQCAAFLMPITWDEPFGIVMAEALACGTPVIGFRRGSVPEVVRHGTTGFVVDDLDGMVTAIGRVDVLDRSACRRDAETRFSPDAVVSAYEALYRDAVRHSTRAEAVPLSTTR